MKRSILPLPLMALLLASITTHAQTQYAIETDGIVFSDSDTKRKVKISAYGDEIFRVQTSLQGQPFFADNHYQMVESHSWRQPINIEETGNSWQLSVANSTDLFAKVDKENLKVSFWQNGELELAEAKPIEKISNRTSINFVLESNEHFTGLGHSYYGREDAIDLKGKRVGRNYGSVPIEQAPLIVPFYLSSKGYGVFLNSTFTNEFSFGDQGEYSISIDDHGFESQMDYFFIAGEKLTSVLDNYTELTGRPRLPTKSMLGLQLSDKGHDHNTNTPSDQAWWQQKIGEHRAADFPIDHVVNDNRWRAAGGKRCESKLAWDEERYPDPAAYKTWLDENGLVITLDFNRCIGRKSEGWQPSFNLPDIKNIEFPLSAPDLTNQAFRDWFWDVFYKKGLNPEQGYPGDALWIDEFDEQGAADKAMVLSNGRSSAEMRNYWFFLISKALVADGWDKSGIEQRPFVWVRGMTAGAQRYATLWSGDIYPNNKEFATQVRAMQLAGLSGFPFWGHDAGGFYDWNNEHGPDESLYQRWSAGFGSFAPIWKPHGMGQSRWPLDRATESQSIFMAFSKLRYQLMAYTYSAAHQSALTGLPMARAMLLDYQDEPQAWQQDLQYMWGDSILVTPKINDDKFASIWLPKGTWYGYENGHAIIGDRVIHSGAILPLYVKAGAIIPQREYALSTAFIDKSKLGIDLYLGANGRFDLIEDDDKTEQYRQGQKQVSSMIYEEKTKTLTIKTAQGEYEGAAKVRDYTFRVFGDSSLANAKVNGKVYPLTETNKGKVLILTGVSANKDLIITLN